MQTKLCRACKQEIPFNLLINDKTCADGKSNICKPCRYSQIKQYNQIKKAKEKQKEYYLENKEKYHQRYLVSYSKNRDGILTRNSLWSTENKEQVTALRAKRRAAKKQATPSWLTVDDYKSINSKYAIARFLTEVVGVPYHVDHNVPLQGESVCGLHVPSNLSVLIGTDNIRKSNTWQG